MVQARSAITRPDLMFSVEEFNLEANRKRYAGLKILKPRIVGLQSAEFACVPPGQLLAEDENITRASGAAYNRDEFEFDKKDYKTSDHGVEEVIDDRESAIFRDLVDAESVSAGRALNKVAQRLEIEICSMVTDAAVWTGDALATTVDTAWDAANATPFHDIENARQKIIDGCGHYPDTLVLGRKAFFALSMCDDIVNRVLGIIGWEPKTVGADTLQTLLGIDRVVVAGGLKNTANRGQTAVFAPIWPDDLVMLCKTATSDDPAEVSIGRTFAWSEEAGYFSDAELIGIVEEYREENVRGSILRCRADWGPKILYSQCGHHLTGVLTAAE